MSRSTEQTFVCSAFDDFYFSRLDEYSCHVVQNKHPFILDMIIFIFSRIDDYSYHLVSIKITKSRIDENLSSLDLMIFIF